MKRLATILACAAACANPTVVEVTLTVREGLPAMSSLRVEVRNDGDDATQRFSVSGRSFPQTFTVTADGRSGEISIEVFGLDALDTEVALARARTTLASDQAISLNAQLEPADFVVNSKTDGAQRTAFRAGRNGRAVTATPDGLAVAFVDDCLVGSACDVFVRRFDEYGAPLPLAGSLSELSVNTAVEPRVSVPALAATGAGEIGVVWETDDAIRFSRISAAGDLVTTDVKVTAATVENPVDPAIAPSGNNFVLSWYQESDSPVLAGIQRAVVTNGVVGAISTTRGERTAATVSLASDGATIAAAWAESGMLLAQVGPAAGGGTPAVVATFGTEFLSATQTARVDGGYVISYGRQASGVSGGLMLTRIDGNGTRVRDVVVSETSDRATDRPAIAVDDENRVAVVWTACEGEGEPDGDGCAVLLRLFNADLSPLTNATVINTTTVDDQFDPAVVATAVGFAVVWTDNSGAPPDTSIAVRARIVYIDTLL